MGSPSAQTDDLSPFHIHILRNLYSADNNNRLVPLTDASVPAFEAELAVENLTETLTDLGFQSVRPSQDGRQVYGKIYADSGPSDLVIADWSDHVQELRPLEDISLPTQRKCRSFEYVRGVPNGLVSDDPYSWVPTREEREEPLVSLRQVFLPFRDPVSATEGWQFAFPPLRSGLADVDLSIRVLTRKGNTYQILYPSFREEPDRLPTPFWAWVPIETPERVVHARLGAPIENRGMYQIKLSSLDGNRIYTPYGARKRGIFGFEPHSAWDIELPTVPDGTYEVHLADMALSEVSVSDRKLDYVEPQELAYDLELWACHVFRVAQTFLRHEDTGLHKLS